MLSYSFQRMYMSQVAIGCAYILADVICAALPDALHGRPLYLAHHVFTLALGNDNYDV